MIFLVKRVMVFNQQILPSLLVRAFIDPGSGSEQIF